MYSPLAEVRSSVRRRKWLLALWAVVGLACHGASPPAAAPAARPAAPVAAAPPAAANLPLYLVIYRAGPSWPAGEGMPPVLREHFRYLLQLHQRGELKQAGPFANERGGAAVFAAADDAAAQAWVEADPAVRSQVFQFELRRWSPVDWQSHAKPSSP